MNNNSNITDLVIKLDGKKPEILEESKVNHSDSKEKDSQTSSPFLQPPVFIPNKAPQTLEKNNTGGTNMNNNITDLIVKLEKKQEVEDNINHSDTGKEQKRSSEAKAPQTLSPLLQLPIFIPQIDEKAIENAAVKVKGKGSGIKKSSEKKLQDSHEANARSLADNVAQYIMANASEAESSINLKEQKITHIKQKVKETPKFLYRVVSSEVNTWDAKAVIEIIVALLIGIAVTATGVISIQQVIMNSPAFVDEPTKACLFSFGFILPAVCLHLIYRSLHSERHKKILFYSIGISGLVSFSLFLFLFGWQNASQLITSSAGSIFNNTFLVAEDSIIPKLSYISQLLFEATLGGALFMGISIIWDSNSRSGERDQKIRSINAEFQALEDEKSALENEINHLEKSIQLLTRFEKMRDQKINELRKNVTLKFNNAVRG